MFIFNLILTSFWNHPRSPLYKALGLNQDVIVGVLSTSCPSLNYLLIAKIYFRDCRRNQTLPNINGCKVPILIKYDTENYIGHINKKNGIF